MAYKIVYKPYAERDLWETADYLADRSIPAAKHFLKKLKTTIEGLSEMPLRYPLINSNREYRKMSVPPYVVVYIVDERAKTVQIVRIVHGKRNYQDNI